MNADRKAIRNRIDQVRQVLLAHWDPLQVGSNRMLSDEYDSYLAGIIKALDAGDPDRIVDALIKSEEDLGMGAADRESLAAVAQRLLEAPRA